MNLYYRNCDVNGLAIVNAYQYSPIITKLKNEKERFKRSLQKTNFSKDKFENSLVNLELFKLLLTKRILIKKTKFMSVFLNILRDCKKPKKKKQM